MRRYLVEEYVSDPSALAAVTVATNAAGVRHVRSAFVPDDEMCLHFFEAPSARALATALRRAGIGCDRIVETIEEVGER